MIFRKLCSDYVQKHRRLFYSYIAISSFSYLVRIIITPMIYTNIMSISSDNFGETMKQIGMLWCLIGVIYIVKSRMENQLFPAFLSFIRQRLLRLFLEKNKTNFNDSNVSTDITRIFEVTRYMRDLFGWVVQSVIPMLILTGCINMYFFYKIPAMGMVNLVCNTTIGWYINKNYQHLIDNSNKRENKYMGMVTKLDENFNNLLNIYLNNQMEQTLTENETIEKEYIDIYRKQNEEVMNFTNNLKLITYVFAFICLYIVYRSGSLKTSSKEFISILLIFTFYISTLENLSEDVPNYMMVIGNIMNAEPFLEGAVFTEKKKVDKGVLDEEKDDTSVPSALFRGNIRFDGISFRYNDVYVFKDFSLDIHQGQRIGILGKTGKGKSTLMKLLLNFYPLESGAILLDGKELKEWDVDEVRSQVNYVNQKTNLFNDTILNNMRYGNDATDEEVLRVLLDYDLLKVFGPDVTALDKVVEKNGANISMGMQKTIFLVRGVLKDCSVFVFDEPFSGIDQRTRESVLRMIDERTKGKTVLVITHDRAGLETILDKMIEL